MAIPVDRDREFNPAMKKIMDKLDKILRYQENFDSEIFDSLSRLEEKIDLTKSNTELQLKELDKVMKELKKVK